MIPSSSTVSTRPLRSSAAQPRQRNDTQYGAAASINQHGAVDGDAVITLNFVAAGVVALYAAGSYHAVQAAEAAGTLTLACDGMKTTQPSVPDPKPEALSMGITLDFTARRVDGFGSDAGLRITIPDVTETTITFEGSNEDDLGRTQEHHIRGMINRVTGVLQANEAMWTKKTPTRIIEYFYLLKCRPA